MAVAYLITAYRYPRQLGRLVRRLTREAPGSRVLVHVDGKVDLRPFVEACDGSPVEFLDRRRDVRWGSFSMVRATMDLAELSRRHEFTHAILLSEQCYPVRPLEELEDLLSTHADQDFIDLRHVASEWPVISPRFEKFYFREWSRRAPRTCWLAKKVLGMIRPIRQPPGGVSIHAGSTWWALSRASLDQVLDEHRTNRRLRRFFSLTLIPEEMYVHTILGNSPRGECTQPSITYARFDKQISISHPLVWTRTDTAELESSGCFFARKFDESLDAEVLDYFDQHPSASDGSRVWTV
ncbi:MAG: beta-1,6-N-acetylglucosaminyltransferase [Acidimicrobiales bacterium]